MKADSILYGNILTLDDRCPRVEAMAVRNGRILFLGSREEADALKGSGTETLDFRGCTVYPGFMDAHTHGPMAGERLVMQAQLVGCASMQEYADRMADYMRRFPDKKVYLGAGWDRLEEPSAAMLDAICPDRPMILRSSDAHSVWLNTAAMKDCGIDRAAVEKYGTAQIHTDTAGNPSGMVTEDPMYAVLAHYPMTIEDMKDSLLAWQEFAFSQGITAVGEAYLDMYPVSADAYAELVREGKWKLRTYASVMNRDALRADPSAAGALLKEQAAKYDSETFRILGQKIILDGIVEAHTAYLLEDYQDQPGYRGVLNIQDAEELNAIVLSANRAGFPVQIHAIGDGAAKLTLDAYQAAAEACCHADLRNAICHLQLIRPQDVRRCGELGVIAVAAPLWFPVAYPFFADTIRAVGEERAWNEYPQKAFADAGARICFHTDYPISPFMDVPLSVYTAVKRCLPDDYPGGKGGPKSQKNPAQAISAEQALRALTTDPAYMLRAERDLGSLSVGKIANASVYDRDFIHVSDPEEICGAKLTAAIVDGKAVWRG